MELQVTNRSDRPFTFEQALHTYFSVGDVRTVTIGGLGGASFIDKNAGPEARRQEEAEEGLKLTGPTDRVYQDTQATCVIDDPAPPGNGRKISIAKENSNSTVVWNPWSDMITAMADLDPQEWPRFVCVETANVRDHAIALPAGARHTMTAKISLHQV